MESLTKSPKFATGRWTEEEHEIFLNGLKMYGRDWKHIQSLIKTRSSTQVRTHAQKFFSRDKYPATKRGRYSSRLKDIDSPSLMQWLTSDESLRHKKSDKTPFPQSILSNPRDELKNEIKFADRIKRKSARMKKKVQLHIPDGRSHYDKVQNTCEEPQVKIEKMTFAAINSVTSNNSRSTNTSGINTIGCNDRQGSDSIEGQSDDFSVQSIDTFGIKLEPVEFVYLSSNPENSGECLDWLADQDETSVLNFFGTSPYVKGMENWD